MPGWWSEDDETDYPDPPAVPEVESAPNEVIGQLLGPDGAPLFLVLERPVVPCGFQAAPKEASAVVRLW